MEFAVAAQGAQPAGGFAVLATALALGLRHGIDWDHLAAISDITSAPIGLQGQEADGTKGRTGPARLPGATSPPLTPVPTTRRRRWRPRPGGPRIRSAWLAVLYAVGHAVVVVALGLAALHFRAVLPDWVDPVMERLVGVTLLALGSWVVYSLVRSSQGDEEFRLRSRWMLVFAGVRNGWRVLQAQLHGHAHAGQPHVHRVDQYGPGTAFGTGVIHGVGAETGTQVLLITAVGGAASQGLGTGMLLAFVVGLLLSNTAVAVLTSAGFFSAARVKALYLVVGCFSAVLSLYVGGYALLGISDQLPDLKSLLEASLDQPRPGRPGLAP